MERLSAAIPHPLSGGALAGLVLGLILCQPVGAAQISGSVQTSDGTPVSGAIVTILVRPPLPSTNNPVLFNTQVTTNSDGTFSVTEVPQGNFAVCVSAAGTNLLPPCTWETEPIVTLAPNQSLKMPPIQLKSGVDFYVRVNDLNGRQASMEGKVPGAALMLGIRAPSGLIVPISKTASDSTGSDYHLLVPAATNLAFIPFSQAFSLTNAAGIALDKQGGPAQPINISNGATQHREIINIQ